MPVKYKIPIEIIELDDKSFHLLIEVKINANPVNLIIDTGASRTVFDKSLPGIDLKKNQSKNSEEIHSAGITAGNIESQAVIVKSFKLGKLKLRNFPVVLIDLESINKLYMQVTGKRIHGLLGSDFLLEMNAVIHYGKSSLILKSSGKKGR
jgi:predicted aspartyl protease